MKKVVLSIVIINYKTKKLTLDCLKSIDMSGFEAGLEVLVVDNHSEDGSVEVLKKYNPKNFDYYFIESEENGGFSKGNNLAIQKAHGRYVMLLNSDTKVLKGTLNKLVEFADKTTDAGVIGPRLLNTDKSIQGSVFRLPTLWRAIQQYWLGSQNLLDKYAPKGDKPVEVESVVGAAFMITPEARKRVGLLDEKYFMYFEDLDYCKRVLKSGLKIYYLPSAKIIHIHGASGGTNKSLIAASKFYHRTLNYYLITAIMWIGQKWQK